MSKIIKFILIIAVIFVGISLIGTLFDYLGKQQLEGLGLGTDQIQQLFQEEGIDSMPDISMLDISNIKSTDFEKKEQGYKEFVSPDGKLKLSYPSSWLEVEGENLNDLQEKAESHGLKFLFLAQNLNLAEFGQTLVHEGYFDYQEEFEQIIEKMKQVNQEQGWDMQVINLEIKDEEAVFEAKYQKTDRYSLRSKEKIILIETIEGKKKMGLIAFIVFDKNWPDFKEQADFVISSAIINK